MEKKIRDIINKLIPWGKTNKNPTIKTRQINVMFNILYKYSHIINNKVVIVKLSSLLK